MIATRFILIIIKDWGIVIIKIFLIEIKKTKIKLGIGDTSEDATTF